MAAATATKSTAMVRAANAMTVYGKVDNPADFCNKMGTAIAALVGCSPPTGNAIALVCLCEGITPLDFTRKYHLIEGKPSMKSSAMLAEFRMNEGGKYIVKQTSPKIAEIEFVDAQGEKYTEQLTRLDLMLSRWPWTKDNGGWKARTAEVRAMAKAGKTEDEIFDAMLPRFKDNYGTEADWKNMLFARLTSESLRAICPEMAAGIYTPEEMQDVIEGEIVPSKTATESAAAIAARLAEQALQAGEQAIEQMNGGSTDEAVAESAAADIVAGGAAIEEDVIDVPFEADDAAVDPATKKAVEVLEALYVEAFGDQATAKIAESCAGRKVNHLHEIPAETRNQMATNLRNFIREQKAVEGND